MFYKYKVLLWTVVLIIVAIGLSWYTYQPGTDPTSNANAPFQSARNVTFNCDGQKVIKAQFADKSVRLQVSNGLNFMLRRTVSASGARYANKDDNVVFWNKGNTAFMMRDDSMWISNCVREGQDDLVNLKQFKTTAMPIRFRYPHVLEKNRVNVTDTTGWSSESQSKGQLLAQFRLSNRIQPHTNLQEAMFTVGRSKASEARKNCLQSPRMTIAKADSIKKSGQLFVYNVYSDAGAGNYYTVRQYRALRNRYCYSIEEMVHSTNVHAYPKSRNISTFDSARVWKALDVPWQTFSFTK